MSPAGLQALRFGVAEARRRGAALHAVRVFGFQPAWHGPDVARYETEFAAESTRYVHDAFDLAMAGPPPDLTVRIQTPNAAIAYGLAAAADRPSDLLVLGGRVGRRRGAIITTCLRLAVCPVVVVPPPPLAATTRRGWVRRLIKEVAETQEAR
jgi:nucleotide-binding universal stress UspA family protein